MWSCPSKLKFMKHPLNIIDLVVIIPFYLGLFLDKYDFFIRIKYVFQVLRVLRILKIARYSKQLQTFGITFKKSYKELLVLFMFMGLNILLFSSLIYYVEIDNTDTEFDSIVSSFWWSVITLTTVSNFFSCYFSLYIFSTFKF